MKAVFHRLQVERRLMELGIVGKTLTLKVRWSNFELVIRATSQPLGFHLALDPAQPYGLDV